MKIAKNIQAMGMALGLGLFVAAGLFVTVAAENPANHQATLSAPIPESVTAPALQLGRAFAAIAAHVKPSVVSVYSEKMVHMQSPGFDFPFGNDFFDQFFGEQFGKQFHAPGQHHAPREFNVPQNGMGTGMILDKKGHILTNFHVVKDVDTIKVQLADKRTFEAKIVGADRKTDVAVLELKGTIPSDLPAVQLGDSDALEVGHLVMAIGAPFGLTQTVTTGILSAKGRSDVGITDYEDFLQTDAPINPGNSGGPLINMRGEVIGMNSAIATSVGQFAGVGFAIPINMIKSMLPTLIKGGQITRGMLGVMIQGVTKELADQFHLPDSKGALISQVNKGSPAERAGLKPGDVIVRFNGKAVNNSGQLRNLVAGTTPGSKADVVAYRNGKEQTFSVTIGKMNPKAFASAQMTPSGANQLDKLGLAVQTLTPDLASQYGIDADKGVLITGVDGGGLAAMSGLQRGDLIVEADHSPVSSVGELQAALSRDKDQILLLVKRQGGSIFVVFRLK